MVGLPGWHPAANVLHPRYDGNFADVLLCARSLARLREHTEYHLSRAVWVVYPRDSSRRGAVDDHYHAATYDPGVWHASVSQAPGNELDAGCGAVSDGDGICLHGLFAGQRPAFLLGHDCGY